MTVLQSPLNNAKELLLQALGDRSPAPAADRDPINGTYGRNLGGSTGEKDLVGHVEELPWKLLLSDPIAQVFGQGDNTVAGNSLQYGRSQGRSKDLVVKDNKEILATPFAHEAIGVQGDNFDKSSYVQLKD